MPVMKNSKIIAVAGLAAPIRIGTDFAKAGESSSGSSVMKSKKFAAGDEAGQAGTAKLAEHRILVVTLWRKPEV